MRKIFVLLLATVMIATMSFGVYATSYEEEGDKGVTVTYSVAPTYIVTIPSSVIIGTSGTEATISAENVVVEKGSYVSVTLDAENDFTVSTNEGATLNYTVISNGNTIEAGDEILAVNPTNGKTGSATIVFDIDEDDIQYAGNYSGVATFTISVEFVRS